MLTHSLKQTPSRAEITKAYHTSETSCLAVLSEEACISREQESIINNTARELIKKVREERLRKGGLDAFLTEYHLLSEEGIALMCLAEALLRIPDKKTREELLKDKILSADWSAHQGHSPSFFVNAATWGLVLTGKILKDTDNKGISARFNKLLEQTSKPIIYKAITHAMQLLGEQFVMGQTIESALKRAKAEEAKGYCFSYDMLGEAARTAPDALRYFQAYQQAIYKIGEQCVTANVKEAPGISIKLSALHPRYEFAKRQTVLPVMIERLKTLALLAKSYGINLTVDAEEAERLDISLDIIEGVFCDPLLESWEGLGVAVQAYQKRAPYVLDWLIELAYRQKKRIMVRLIKGAYWDFEIKNAQIKGLKDYPVFTRKVATDISFIACVKKMLKHPEAIYSQFATHNAYTLATILALVPPHREFEFQCLHGMGYTLYDHIVGPKNLNIPCRIYAPVGGHEDLLAYLVRRLLENGANSSFVNQILDKEIPIDALIFNPVERMKQWGLLPHPKIPLPHAIYGKERKNSAGIDFTDCEELQALQKAFSNLFLKNFSAKPIINGREIEGKSTVLINPAKRQDRVGEVTLGNKEQLQAAIECAHQAFFEWSHRSLEQRAACLECAADLFEKDMPLLMSVLIREGGKTLPDALAEVREAIDFCRYYAAEARKNLKPRLLIGPTGEENWFSLQGRGVIMCISPWNFPLAIFIGQVTAALVTGNTVIAKPAGQTPLIAAQAIKILYKAGIPKEVLHFLPMHGSVVGEVLRTNPFIKGVVFTGSTETAREINQALANLPGPIIPFIAETGGQNAMIVDSSALLEQVVADVLNSAFGSSGQRCSALRVLFVQSEIADKLLTMLTGAMETLTIGDPALLSTDVGPVIDKAALSNLQSHVDHLQNCLLFQTPLSSLDVEGNFFAPALFKLMHLSQLKREVFGPILHFITYELSELDDIIEQINNTGYGLTLGIQSRINTNIDYISKHLNAGNHYVNRSMIGAVVGVQPFGGEGLSGTGPKAGGPYYLPRLCVERAISINTTATGGNTSLLGLEE